MKYRDAAVAVLGFTAFWSTSRAVFNVIGVTLFDTVKIGTMISNIGVAVSLMLSLYLVRRIPVTDARPLK